MRLDSRVSETAAPVAPHPPIERRSYRWVALPLLAFALFSLTAGLLAAHDPRSKGYFRLFFEDPIHLKAGFASAAVALGCFQVFSATWIYGKLPWRKPAWINPAHRWSGRLAFVFTLPVAYHCIFKLGFRQPDTRVLAHSLLGCAFYGAYASKITIVRLRRFPVPVLPIAGGMLFAVLIGVWYTSAAWLYTREHPPRRRGCGCHSGGRACRRREERFRERGLRDVPHAESRRRNRADRTEPRRFRPGYEQVLSKVEMAAAACPRSPSNSARKRSGRRRVRRDARRLT